MKDIEYLINEKIISSTPLSGGCIGSSYKIVTELNCYFVKKYSKRGVSNAEAIGLLELKKSKAIKVPKVINYSDKILVLEYIEESSKGKSYFCKLGKQLAKLHKYTNVSFGFESNNFIGDTPQINDVNKSWIDFYINTRLGYQINLAKRNGFDLVINFNRLKGKIPEILEGSIEAPALIHGDLWGGNIMACKEGEPVLIDPAVYYGHREAELAMTKLFGGFSGNFYKSYNEEYPLKKGWQERENLYKLYHILNHLNLFGSSYFHQAKSLMDYYL